MKRPNTTTVLLAVVAVLLGLNLLARPQAAAQPQLRVPEVTGLATDDGIVLRVWSNGVVQWRAVGSWFPTTWHIDTADWAEVAEP